MAMDAVGDDRGALDGVHATILWRRLDLPGHEVASLRRRDDGWELSGTALFAHEERPCRLDYVVTCHSDWRTRSAAVRGTVGERAVDLRVSVDEELGWRLNGVEAPSVAGCTDIDLGFSPSTNLLPIRRLALSIGEAVGVSAAWLPFPALVFEPLDQSYRREEEHRYRYESGGGRFVRDLDVDASGLVVRYPGLWEAEALWRP